MTNKDNLYNNRNGVLNDRELTSIIEEASINADFFLEGNVDVKYQTPTVVLNKENLYIKGVSNPEFAIELYTPVIEKVRNWAIPADKKYTISVILDDFNTSTSKCLLDIFKEIEYKYKHKEESVIRWYYLQDDEDMLEAGEDFEDVIRAPFRLIERED